MAERNEYYRVRNAYIEDLPVVMKMVEKGRERLAKRDVDQWQGQYPDENGVKESILHKQTYIVLNIFDEPVASFALQICEIDPDQSTITGGRWLTNDPYHATLHRLVVAPGLEGTGAACFAVQWMVKFLEKNPMVVSLRADTHPDNIRMQNLLDGMEFMKRGVMKTTLEPGHDDRRVAYERFV